MKSIVEWRFYHSRKHFYANGQHGIRYWIEQRKIFIFKQVLICKIFIENTSANGRFAQQHVEKCTIIFEIQLHRYIIEY